MYSHSKSSLGIKLDALIRVREPDIGKSDAHVVLDVFLKRNIALALVIILLQSLIKNQNDFPISSKS